MDTHGPTQTRGQTHMDTHLSAHRHEHNHTDMHVDAHVDSTRAPPYAYRKTTCTTHTLKRAQRGGCAGRGEAQPQARRSRGLGAAMDSHRLGKVHMLGHSPWASLVKIC